MEGNTEVKLKDALQDIGPLVNIWQKIGPEAQTKLKLVIDNKIRLLRACVYSLDPWEQAPKYVLLDSLVKLETTLKDVGMEADAVHDAIMEEIEAMIAKNGIGTPATTEVRLCFYGVGDPHS